MYSLFGNVITRKWKKVPEVPRLPVRPPALFFLFFFFILDTPRRGLLARKETSRSIHTVQQGGSAAACHLAFLSIPSHDRPLAVRAARSRIRGDDLRGSVRSTASLVISYTFTIFERYTRTEYSWEASRHPGRTMSTRQFCRVSRKS